MNKLLILFLAMALLGALFLVLGKPTAESLPNPNDIKEPSQVCAQVMTSARNPATGQIKVYPTPCDVPDGWEVVINEVPGLNDYQPQ